MRKILDEEIKRIETLNLTRHELPVVISIPHSGEYITENMQENFYEAAQKWDDKQARKEQSQLNRRESQGISVYCPLLSWETPTIRRCKGCKLKCSFNR